jgi:hypothetical protein
MALSVEDPLNRLEVFRRVWLVAVAVALEMETSYDIADFTSPGRATSCLLCPWLPGYAPGYVNPVGFFLHDLHDLHDSQILR